MKIHTIDLTLQGLPRTTASYLIEAPGGPILIETGPGSSLSTLLTALEGFGLSPSAMKHIFVTHIHLDHAGAAGWWASQGAQVYVHYVGAPHLIDPRRLIASAARIYGDQMDALWGDILPAPKERIFPLYDGNVVDVAGISLRSLDTPGHASHHHTYILGDVAFTGDAAGVRISDTSFIDVPAPPPEFNLEAWHETIDRLLQHTFKMIYPTHFGGLTDWRWQLETLRTLLDEAVVFVKERLDAGVGRDAILKDFEQWRLDRAEAVGMSAADLERCALPNPPHMSVDGISRYLRKKDDSR